MVLYFLHSISVLSFYIDVVLTFSMVCRQETFNQWYYQPFKHSSSKEIIFRVTGPLWGDSIGHRWNPLRNTSDAELRCFVWSAPEQTVQQTIEVPSGSLWRHYNDINAPIQCDGRGHSFDRNEKLRRQWPTVSLPFFSQMLTRDTS